MLCESTDYHKAACTCNNIPASLRSSLATGMLGKWKKMASLPR